MKVKRPESEGDQVELVGVFLFSNPPRAHTIHRGDKISKLL